MVSRTSPKTIILIAAGVLLLWWSWDVLTDLARVIGELWAWRPETVVGAAMIIVPILVAGPLHYFLNVRRTSQGGVIEVTGLADYLAHGIANLIVRLGLVGSILVGIFILLFGWDIR